MTISSWSRIFRDSLTKYQTSKVIFATLMTKSTIVLFFSIIFLTFILAPVIIMAIDDSTDISYFYTISEEEKTDCEKVKEVKLLISVSSKELEAFYALKSINQTVYTFKNYSKPHLNLVSPPPEFI